MNIKSAQNTQKMLSKHSFIELSIFCHFAVAIFYKISKNPAHTEHDEWKEQHSWQNLLYPFSNIAYLGNFST